MFRTLKPERVYVTEDVYEDAGAAARAERVLTAVEGARVEKVSLEELNAIAPERWPEDRRWGEVAAPRDPDIVMTTGKFWPEERRQALLERFPNLGPHDLAGFTTTTRRRDGDADWRQAARGCVCQSAWELHTVIGCPFRCSYCGCGGRIRMLVNIEEYVEHLDEICGRKPFQRLYKWDNVTDVSCFEPEYDATRPLVDYFARTPEKYLEIYVGKSDNVDHLLGLDHRGKTILQWSLSPRTQSTVIEPETAPWDRRVEAAGRCGEAGYVTRFRFSPIIPVKGWREEYAELIELVFARSKPDVISLCALGWMDLEDARRCLDFSLLDPEFLAAMEADAPFLRNRGFTHGGGRPIPHDARAYLFKVLIDEIRRRNRTIPIALCLETAEMWALFEKELGLSNRHGKDSYFCNCGPLCTPEHPCSAGVTPGPSLFP